MGVQVSFDRWCHDFDGLVVAEVSGDVEAIVRNLNGIRRDDAEYIYCVIQATGQLKVEHNGQILLLGPGECVLLDSIKGCAMSFVNAGRLLLLQLPRNEFLRTCNGNIRIGHLLPADHPLAPVISHQIKKFASGRMHGTSAGGANSDLILGMIQLAFSNLDDCATKLGGESKDRQFALALDLIQQNLTSSELSLPWLSRQVGMSSRQLQRMFEFENTSFSSEVRDRRLNAAAARLRSAKTARRIHISEVAYDSGFRDLSNFNRGFKSRFGMAPSEYIQTIA